MPRKYSDQVFRDAPDRAGWWLAAMVVAITLVAASVSAQSADPDPQPDATPQNGVVAAPPVDPSIRVKPPVAADALPTPVIPPPGTKPGDGAAVPK